MDFNLNPTQVGSNTDEGRSFAPTGANTTADVIADLTGTIPSQSINNILDLYPDVPSLGCPFNTGDFQLDPVQNGAFSTPGAQNKRVAAIVGDASMAAYELISTWDLLGYANRFWTTVDRVGLRKRFPRKFRSINTGSTTSPTR